MTTNNPDDLIKRSDALNALEAYRIRLSEETGFHLKGHLAVLNNDINSIPAARSDKGEAVAWINKDHTYVQLSDKSTVYGSHTIPLYLAAPQQAIPAEIIRYVGTTEDSGKADSHPNDNEPRCY
jgi:hypothetical protein